jgi:TRAP-type C4-dicarboxylate transport system permease small subunit
MSYATIYRKHITIDILTVVFYKKHPQFVLTLRWIGKLLWAAFTFFMIYQGYLMARKSYYSDEISAAMCLPLVFVYSSLSVGFLLMAYWLIKQLIQEFKEIFYRA